MIISIDGVCASGKTSVIQHIAEQRSIKVISEFMDYDIASEVSFISADNSNACDIAKNNLKILGRIEQLRNQQLRMMNIEDDIIFVDRSYMSCLAFDYAIDRMGVNGIFQYSRAFWNTVTTLPIHQSVVFNIAHETTLLRVVGNEQHYCTLLLNSEFNRHFMEYFRKFSNDSINIEISDNESIADISVKIMRFLQL